MGVAIDIALLACPDLIVLYVIYKIIRPSAFPA